MHRQSCTCITFNVGQAQQLDAQPTGFCRLHPLAPTRLTVPQDPPCPSTAFISSAIVDEKQ